MKDYEVMVWVIWKL